MAVPAGDAAELAALALSKIRVMQHTKWDMKEDTYVDDDDKVLPVIWDTESAEPDTGAG